MSATEQIKELETLTTKILCQKLNELTGKSISSNNKPYLLKQLTKALQSQVQANDMSNDKCEPNVKVKISEQTGRLIDPIQKKDRDARLPPPGTILERDYDGKKIRATVLEDGFKYQGKNYRSLSAIAKEVAHCNWNGFLFFHLIGYAKRKKSKSS